MLTHPMGNTINPNKIKEIYENKDAYPRLKEEIWYKYWILYNDIHKNCDRKYDCINKEYDKWGYYYTDKEIKYCGCSSPKKMKQIKSHFTKTIKKLFKYLEHIKSRYSNTWGIHRPDDYNKLLNTIQSCINRLIDNINEIDKSINKVKHNEEKKKNELKYEKYVSDLIKLEL